MKATKDYINLLPIEEQRTSLTLGPGMVLMSLVVLLWLVAYGWQAKQAWGLKGQLGSLTEKKQALFQELRAIQKELGIPISTGMDTDKAVLIQSLLRDRVLWSEVFKHFSRIVPKGLWFDNLEGSSAERAEIRVKGGAYNYLSVAEFMLAIEESVYFDKPQLLYARRAVVQGQEVIGFEMICGILKGQGVP